MPQAASHYRKSLKKIQFPSSLLTPQILQVLSRTHKTCTFIRPWDRGLYAVSWLQWVQVHIHLLPTISSSETISESIAIAIFRPCLRSERKHREGIEWDKLKTWWTVSWHKYLNTTFHNHASCLDSWLCVCAREDGDRMQRHGRDKSERADYARPVYRAVNPSWDDLL